MNGKLIDGATRAIGLSALAILALSHAAQAAPNLPLHNPGFEIVGLDGPLTVTSPATLGGGGTLGRRRLGRLPQHGARFGRNHHHTAHGHDTAG